MARTEEIVDHEDEVDAKELIKEIYSKQFVHKIAEWKLTEDNGMLKYQNLIKNKDIDSTYSLMLQQIEQKKKEFTKQRRTSYFSRAKRKAKNVVRPLNNKMRSDKSN